MFGMPEGPEEMTKMARNLLDKLTDAVKEVQVEIEEEKEKVQSIRENWKRASEQKDELKIISSKLDILMGLVVQMMEDRNNSRESGLIKKSKVRDELEAMYSKVMVEGAELDMKDFMNFLKKMGNVTSRD